MTPCEPDILPRPGRESAPAGQSLAFQLIEVFCLGPLPDNVAVGHHDDRGLRMGLHQTHRLARLDHQRLILVHAGQSRADRIMGRPVAGRLAERSIDHQIVRILTDRQHILHQAQQGFLPPALGAKLRP